MSIRTRSLSKLAASLVLAVSASAHAQDPSQDETSKYGERVQQGMQQYAAGAFREAIGWWDPVYRELGQHTAYRLAFNLARAYEKFSDFTMAAQHYEAFLSEVVARRKIGEAIVPIVEKEEKEAIERLKQLRETKGRIRVSAGARPTDARVDALDRRASGFVAYVVPGSHTVTFLNGNEVLEKRDVVVDAGEEKEIAPPPPPVVVLPPAGVTRTVHEVDRPFSPIVLYIGGGVTLASIIVPVLTYGHATSLSSSYDDPATPRDRKAQISGDYTSARKTAYATVAIPLALLAITGGLTAFYFFGTKERDVLVASPVLSPVAGGFVAGATGRF